MRPSATDQRFRSDAEPPALRRRADLVLAVAAALSAATMALLGYASGGALGNFGGVGVDQTTFAPGVFFWFFVVGAATVVMSGGVARRPKRVPAPAEPVSDLGSDPFTQPIVLPETPPEPGPSSAHPPPDCPPPGPLRAPIT